MKYFPASIPPDYEKCKIKHRKDLNNQRDFLEKKIDNRSRRVEKNADFHWANIDLLLMSY